MIFVAFSFYLNIVFVIYGLIHAIYLGNTVKLFSVSPKYLSDFRNVWQKVWMHTQCTSECKAIIIYSQTMHRALNFLLVAARCCGICQFILVAASWLIVIHTFWCKVGHRLRIYLSANASILFANTNLYAAHWSLACYFMSLPHVDSVPITNEYPLPHTSSLLRNSTCCRALRTWNKYSCKKISKWFVATNQNI